MIVALVACGRVALEAPILESVTALQGTATWTVTPDAGGAPCTYSRAYDGTLDVSVDWLCPACDEIWRVDSVLSGRACFDTISDDPPAVVEWLGREGETWYRASTTWAPLSEQGEVAQVGDALTWVSSASSTRLDLAPVTLDIAGALTLSEVESDPWFGLRPPSEYVCGWPKEDPAPYRGAYALDVGSHLPDGVLEDLCGQGTRLHDFAGRWLVVEFSAMDCGPCQSAAAEEAAFVEGLAKDGIEVVVITVLVATLDDILASPTLADVEAWTETFALEGPVLRDRGWGYASFGLALGDGLAFPAGALVDPNRDVVDVWTGYGGWDPIADAIRGRVSGDEG